MAAIGAWPACADTPDPAPPLVDAGLEFRYRYEGVDQDGVDRDADANTLRVRANFATREYRGFSGSLELDLVEAIGSQRYNDTRNGNVGYPVVADPEGADLNQAWLQFAPRADTRFRVGRQRLNLDNERFVGSSGWRQNEQTLDAFRIETTAIPKVTLNYAFVDRVNRVFGPDTGVPPEAFEGATHLLNARWLAAPTAAFVAYAYLLDFDEAPQLSSRSLGLRYEGSHALHEGFSLAWTLEYASQRDAGDNPSDVDATYALAEVRAKLAVVELQAGQERLSGERGTASPTDNAAFQTPLATLHKWQGWADKFLTTPPAGIRDTFVGASLKRDSWRAQAAWHDFAADATSQNYGRELDLLVAVTIHRRFEFMLKFADYEADEAFTDTRKVWAQVGAVF